MEIRGTIKSIHVDQIRLITTDKNQEIDIFYTEIKKFDVEELVENERVVLDVRIQSIDYYGLKLGKFWLSQIVFPKKSYEYRRKPNKRDRDQAAAQQQFIDRTNKDRQ
ncbi:hypothetical protein OA84_10655 [Kaistella solincola]|uniref:Uncharacterized protein n=1 Tax=Kaistella solincola TaxID=510955 RepID=A0ABR4ZP81_9FLAO|nr:hypothetical protein [Kaistella solincola]KIA82604.1 hypothetical protein OA84_10655 [Kaistella solincola]